MFIMFSHINSVGNWLGWRNYCDGIDLNILWGWDKLLGWGISKDVSNLWILRGNLLDIVWFNDHTFFSLSGCDIVRINFARNGSYNNRSSNLGLWVPDVNSLAFFSIWLKYNCIFSSFFGDGLMFNTYCCGSCQSSLSCMNIWNYSLKSFISLDSLLNRNWRNDGGWNNRMGDMNISCSWDWGNWDNIVCFGGLIIEDYTLN